MQNLIKDKYDYFYYFVIISAFAMPLSRAAASIFVAISIAFFIFNFKEYKNYLEFFKKSKLAQALLLMIVYKLISLLWTQNLDKGLYTKILYVEWIAIFSLGFYLRGKNIFPIISAFIAGMFVSEILSYGIFFHLTDMKGIKGSPSPFMLHISYSVFLAFTAIILLNRILSESYSLKEKIFYSIFFLTVTGNLFISNGRTGQLAFMVAIFAVFLIHFKFKLKTVLISLSFIALTFILAYNFAGNNFKNRVNIAINDIKLLKKGNFQSSWGQRVAMYIVTYDCFKKEPIFGAGVGDYLDAPKEALEQNSHRFNKNVVKFISTHHLHNQYLHEIVSGGLAALILLLYIYYQILKLPIDNRELKELSILFTIIFLVGSIPEPLLIKQFPSTLFILFIGLFLASSQKKGGFESN